MAPLLVPPSLILALMGPWWPEAAVPSAIWLMACLTIGLYLGVRHRSACVLASSLAFMVMHLAWGTGFLAQAFTRRREPAAPAPMTFPNASGSALG
jgi:succinoglycan biosynthesis protein ExoA